MSTILGIGFDYVDLPVEGVKPILSRLAGMISHVSVMAIRTEAEARAFRKAVGDLAIIHHLSNIAPADPRGANLDLLRAQDRLSTIMQASWCNEDIGTWDLGPYFLPSFAPPLFEVEVADHIAENIRRMRAICSVPFLPEVPACPFWTGRLSLSAFFGRLLERADANLVADLSHIYSYALSVGESAERIFDALPISRITHLHVAGGFSLTAHPTFYCDSHDRQTPEPILALMTHAIRTCENLMAITFEFVPNAFSLDDLEREITRIANHLEHSNSRSKGLTTNLPESE